MQHPRFAMVLAHRPWTAGHGGASHGKHHI